MAVLGGIMFCFVQLCIVFGQVRSFLVSKDDKVMGCWVCFVLAGPVGLMAGLCFIWSRV